MRVLLLTQYFIPEVTAARARLHAFATGLAERGHDVDVVCEVPNHPSGVIREGFRGRLLVRRRLDGFRANYVWVRARPEKTFVNRILFYGSYAASATAAGLALPRPDVVLASSPPLPAGAAAALVAAGRRAPFVLDVRDLWPEAAVILGELNNERAIRLAERLERTLYRRAAAITTVTRPFAREIADRVADPAKIELIPNGTTRTWLAAGEAEVDRSELGLPDDGFIWLYAGNLGIAQGLEAAIDAAAALGDEFRLVLVGDGPERAALKRRADELPDGSVVFTGLVEPELAARYMRAADALLVSLDAQPALEKFVPSKLFDCCAVGRPVVLAARGEAPRLAGEADAALTVPPADVDALVHAIGRLRDEPETADRLAAAGRRFAASYLRENQVDALEQVLIRVAGRSA
jgi:glycosyltransferase involved in cell wall biosynthesis